MSDGIEVDLFIDEAPTMRCGECGSSCWQVYNDGLRCYLCGRQAPGEIVLADIPELDKESWRLYNQGYEDGKAGKPRVHPRKIGTVAPCPKCEGRGVRIMPNRSKETCDQCGGTG